ncbi:hypothetical protein AJ80_01160 [Polytolypa hystricis UAMH7299]|uniref:Nuclear pore complex component n=1 Tax=Polytolypa hystricis (strain UAMH7299) TaxID=1447883 RepID=A0A2B7Z1U0_POLH7|nr:hypothetical protein AJ80_01160 [Polytolypa hystricis UAMH7299]
MSSLPPSTPKFSAGEVAPTPSPGTWRHPRLKEIVRRQNATTFGDRDVRRILWNGSALVATGFLGKAFIQYSLWLGSLFHFSTYPDAILLVLRLYFLVNILVALYPLYRPKDTLSDIPLTPSQRLLLGLDPRHTAPVTPGSTYLTPPRYRLSSGSRKASPISPGSSPLSGTGSQGPGGAPHESSPFSPSPSPLFHKAVGNGNREGGRRPSFGSPSPLGRSSLRDSTTLRSPSSPSPGSGKGPNLVLSNKWIYEKTRVMSPSSSVRF